MLHAAFPLPVIVGLWYPLLFSTAVSYPSALLGHTWGRLTEREWVASLLNALVVAALVAH